MSKPQRHPYQRWLAAPAKGMRKNIYFPLRPTATHFIKFSVPVSSDKRQKQRTKPNQTKPNHSKPKLNRTGGKKLEK